MALRGNGTIPAVYSARLRLAKQTGMKIMELVAKNVRPRDIMTEAAFHNAETVDMALGCSTNTMLHLPAIAHEAGVELDLRMVNGISDKTPNLCHLAPAGDTYIEDLDRAGGVWAVMKELTKAGLLDTSLPTVTGKTVGENLETAENLDTSLIRPLEEPYSKTGGIAALFGNLAPDGCVVKQSAVAPEMLRHKGPARVFNSEEEAIDAYQRVVNVLRSLLPATREQVTTTVKVCGFSIPQTADEWSKQVTVLKNLRRVLDVFQPEIFERDIDAMIEATESKQERKTSDSQMGFWDRRRHIKEAKSMLRVGAQVEDLHEALLVVKRQGEQWRLFVPHGGWPVLPPKLDDIIATQEQLMSNLTALDTVLGHHAGRGGAPAAGLQRTGGTSQGPIRRPQGSRHPAGTLRDRTRAQARRSR